MDGIGDDACIYAYARMTEPIVVAASTQTDQRRTSSNFGSCVDIFAPGEGITSAFNQNDTATAIFSGTSMAAPHVAGAVALYLEINPDATPETVRQILQWNGTQGVIGNSGAGSPNLLLNMTGKYWSYYKTLTGDVNGDGRTDVLWNETGTTNRTYIGTSEANDTLRFLPPIERLENGWSGYKTLVGDVNGDGRDDIIWNQTSGAYNRTYVGLGTVTGELTLLPFQDRPEGGWSGYKTLTGDVNGDGRTDLIWNVTTGVSNRTYVGLGTPAGSFTFLPAQDHPAGGWDGYKVLADDVNGDGRTDLIWNETRTLNRVYVALANSDGTFTFRNFQDRPEGGWGLYKTLTGDINGDGRADLIWNALTESNRTYVGLAQSDGSFDFRPAQDHPAGGWWPYQSLIDDVNGDGRSDIIWNVTSGSQNRTYVGLGTVAGTFDFLPFQDHPAQGWTSYKTLTGLLC